MLNLKILVATHKKYWMPEDDLYLPIHVGREGKNGIGFIGDNTGDNISKKNANYCELTGIYWAWKNLSADYIGLAHYRRHFTNKNFLFRILNGKNKCVLLSDEAKKLINQYDIILPKKRKYYIETNRSHYNHAHNKRDLDEIEKIIQEKYPQCLSSFSLVMNRTWAHMFNMFLMKRTYYDKYCDWLFSILNELETRIDISKYNAYEARVYGYISELLLDVWIEYNKLSYKEIPVMFMEKQNWIIKGGNFLKRKFIH